MFPASRQAGIIPCNNNFVMMKRITISIVIYLVFAFVLQGQNLSEGIRLYHEKKYEEAGRIFNAVKKGSPGFAESMYYLGRISADQNNIPEAQGFLERAVKEDPQNADYHFALGLVYSQRAMQGNTLTQAMYAGKIRSTFEKVVELDNNNLLARWFLLGFYARAPKAMGGDMNKAKSIANEIRRIHPAEGSRAWGQVYQWEENHKEAEIALKRAVSLAPDSINNHVALGNFYNSVENYNSAISTFENALKHFPGNRNLLYQFGRTSSLSGIKQDEGLKALKQFIDTATDKNHSSLAAAYYHMGQIEQKRGDSAAAKRQYEAALKVNPDHKPSKDALSSL